MKVVALNAYENGEENWITSTQGICTSITTYIKKSKPKLDNLKEGGTPQYHGFIKLLKCPMKQAAANIVMRKKQHLMTKVSRSININFFIFQINSLSTDLTDKAQQMRVTNYKRTTMAKTKRLINS